MQKKYVILVGDGMGDYPCPELGNKSPLQAANCPNMREAAAAGTVQMIQTVPEGMEPGSDVANLSLLGYNPADNYTGRAPIEAAGAAIPLQATDVALRCNLVTLSDDGKMEDYSAGHISSEDGAAIIADIQKVLGNDAFNFKPGISYRHLLIWDRGSVELSSTPPHDIAGRPWREYLPKGEAAEPLRDLMKHSMDVLKDHPVNLARRARGEKEVTSIWLWGQGHSMQLPPYSERFGLSGGIVSAVDLIRGIGLLAGLEAPVIEGATGFIDTNFEGKVECALNMLQNGNFAYVHIEAPDECGHMGDAHKKTEAIELFDTKVVGPIHRELETRGDPYRMIIAMDHRTPVSTRGHSAEPVPMLYLDGPHGPLSGEADFDETVNNGKAEALAYDWIHHLLSK